MANTKSNTEGTTSQRLVQTGADPLGLSRDFVNSLERESGNESLVSVVSTLFEGKKIDMAEVLETIGVTKGRLIFELACIALAPGEYALTIPELMQDASLRKQIIRKAPSDKEVITRLQEAYKHETTWKDVPRLKITASNKLAALSQLRDEIRFAEVQRQRQKAWEQRNKPAAAPQLSGKVIEGDWGTRPNAARTAVAGS